LGSICPFMSNATLQSNCTFECKFYSDGLKDKCLIKETLEILYQQHDDLEELRKDIVNLSNIINL
jgi:hypothetical protein